MLAERKIQIGTWATNFIWTDGEQCKLENQFRKKEVARDPT